ncbi:MAG: ribosome biogenesis GTPase Der [Candidatus Izemoplasmatales bacterium]|jgi:GTP-binding protein|nr:ribosome biogenesis GTPase Der [Candidatus Izemoplasmatales bacterium]
MLPVVAIVGRPNVGKSTIFNRIIGDRIAITDDTPGVTRDRIYGKASWLGHEFNLIDTGGIEISDAPFLTEIKAQAEIAIDESQVIVFICDGKSGLTPDDRVVMNMLYLSKKPVIVAVNKVDNLNQVENIYEFYELGASEVFSISATHGIGFGDLLDSIIDKLPEMSQEDYEEDTIRLSIIGRPNVGKSSLTNAILGYERVIVSDILGTTTDSIDTTFLKDGKKYAVIDTAGLRKRGKIFESLDKYSALRAMQSIERSDVCLLVIDASIGIQEQDKHIGGYAVDSGKAIIIVVNKWDAIDKDDKTMIEWTRLIREEFQFLSYIPVAFVSALNKSRIQTLFPLVEKVYENYERRISTSVLNEVISDAMLLNPPKEHNHSKVKVYYSTQVASKCPTFVLFVNDTECMHFSYYRYLENRLRERFDFEGTPIKIILRKRK